MKKNKLNLDFINYDESDLLVKEAMVVLKKIDFVYPLMNTSNQSRFVLIALGIYTTLERQL